MDPAPIQSADKLVKCYMKMLCLGKPKAIYMACASVAYSKMPAKIISTQNTTTNVKQKFRKLYKKHLRYYCEP